MQRASFAGTMAVVASVAAAGCVAGVDARTVCPASACLEGFACDEAAGVCVRACTAAGGCLDSERCELAYNQAQGLCRPKTYCADDSQCAQGFACTVDAPRICLRACAAAGDCHDDERCDVPTGASSGVCRPRPYSVDTTGCGSLYFDPLTHLCRDPCTVDGDCQTTEYCEPSVGACLLVVSCSSSASECAGTQPLVCSIPVGADAGTCRPSSP